MHARVRVCTRVRMHAVMCAEACTRAYVRTRLCARVREGRRAGVLESVCAGVPARVRERVDARHVA